MTMQRSTIGWMALLVSGLVATPAGAADWQPPDPKEVDAYKEASSRFLDRMQEFQADTKELVEFTRKQEEAKINQTYGSAYRRLDDDNNALRRVAIARMEAFLQNYPDVRDTPEVLYRLADLYFEDAEVNFQAASREYQQLEQQSEANPEMVLPEPPKKDYSRPIALYQQLVGRYPSHPMAPNAWSNLGWCYSTDLSAQQDADKARDVYLQVVALYPNTVYSDDANMRLGEYYFDQVGPAGDATKPTRVAIGYYNTVYARGNTGRFYEKAMYKLGWSYYKLNDYVQALNFLVKLMDYSDQQYARTGTDSDERPEAVQYLAISYADIADRSNPFARPVDVAVNHLRSIGDRKWSHDVVERLADVLVRQAKFESAIEVYAYLQQHWPTHPTNPIYQYKIAQLYAGNSIEVMGVDGPTRVPGMPVRDMAANAAAMVALSTNYSENSTWYIANKNDPEAVAKARGFIEDSTAAVAYSALDEAGRFNTQAAWANAAQKTRDFLDQFPFSPKYDEYEWYYADALFNAQDYRKALTAYQQILRNDRSDYREGSRYRSMECRQEIAKSLASRLGDRVANPMVEKVETSPAGKQITVYRLPDEYTALISSYDDLVQRNFSDPEWAKLLDKDRPAMALLPGIILYNHGHNEEARQRLLAFLKQYPMTDEALDAGGLVLETYKTEGDLDMIASFTDQLLRMQIGADQAKTAAFKLALRNVAEATAFNLANRLVEQGKFLEAANAYQEFMKQFPNSEYVNLALFNSALNFGRGGQAVTANQLYETYIQRYPADERSQSLYPLIAGNYSRILELDKAVTYYDAMYRNFPNAKEAPDALYNASFLRVGLGDHQGAAKGYERYASDYPDRPDAEATFWKAGAQWALVSDNAALDFYQRYLRRYPATEPDHVVEAWYRIASLYDKRKDERRAAQARSELQNAFVNYRDRIGQQGRHYAAEGPVADLLARVEKFAQVKYTGDEKKDVALLLEVKGAEFKALDAAADQIIVMYQDFESAAAAIYIKGFLRFTYSDLAFKVPMPKGFNDEEAAVYTTLLADKIQVPFEDSARKTLSAGIAKAQQEKTWCIWNTKAMELLHDRFPFDYAGERPETRGELNVADVPMAGPESVEIAPPAEATPPTPAPTAPATPAPGGTP